MSPEFNTDIQGQAVERAAALETRSENIKSNLDSAQETRQRAQDRLMEAQKISEASGKLIAVASEQLAGLQSKIDALQPKIDALASKVDPLTRKQSEKLQELQSKITEYQNESDAIANSIGEMQKAFNSSAEQMRMMQADLREMDQYVVAIKGDAALSENLLDNADVIAQREFGQTRENLKTMQDRLRRYNKELRDLQEERFQVVRELSTGLEAAIGNDRNAGLKEIDSAFQDLLNKTGSAEMSELIEELGVGPYPGRNEIIDAFRALEPPDQAEMLARVLKRPVGGPEQTKPLLQKVEADLSRIDARIAETKKNIEFTQQQKDDLFNKLTSEVMADSNVSAPQEKVVDVIASADQGGGGNGEPPAGGVGEEATNPTLGLGNELPTIAQEKVDTVADEKFSAADELAALDFNNEGNPNMPKSEASDENEDSAAQVTPENQEVSASTNDVVGIGSTEARPAVPRVEINTMGLADLALEVRTSTDDMRRQWDAFIQQLPTEKQNGVSADLMLSDIKSRGLSIKEGETISVFLKRVYDTVNPEPRFKMPEMPSLPKLPEFKISFGASPEQKRTAIEKRKTDVEKLLEDVKKVMQTGDYPEAYDDSNPIRRNLNPGEENELRKKYQVLQADLENQLVDLEQQLAVLNSAEGAGGGGGVETERQPSENLGRKLLNFVKKVWNAPGNYERGVQEQADQRAAERAKAEAEQKRQEQLQTLKDKIFRLVGEGISLGQFDRQNPNDRALRLLPDIMRLYVDVKQAGQAGLTGNLDIPVVNADGRVGKASVQLGDQAGLAELFRQSFAGMDGKKFIAIDPQNSVPVNLATEFGVNLI